MILTLMALGLGVITAVALVAAFTFISGLPTELLARSRGVRPFLPLDLQVGFAAWMALWYALALAAICAPVWLLAARLRLANAAGAAALGFVATLLSWITTNLNGELIPPIVLSGLPYAVCGAGAGLATWWSRPQPRRDLDATPDTATAARLVGV